MASRKFNTADRLKSLSNAFRGFGMALVSEHNLWIHLVIMTIVLFSGLFLNISRIDWVAICFAIGMVLSAELMNTAVETLGNSVSEEHNDLIGKAKDIAAGSVLVASITAAVIGVLVFLPYLL